MAAQRIFVEHGYQGATIRKIAEEVGLSSTALYMHFRDKDDILLQIAHDAVAQVIALNHDLNSQNLDPVARVRLMLHGYMRIALANPNAYELVFCSTARNIAPEKRDEALAAGELCFNSFLQAVDAVYTAGRLKIAVARQAAEVLWAASHGMASLLITMPTRTWSDREVLQGRMLDMTLDGMTRPAA